VPKAYFGYEPAEARCRYEPMVVVDRYKAYAFLKELLQLAYCWAHMRRDFLQLRLGGQEDQAWADSWIERIAKLYELNKQRLTFAKSQNGPESLPAPFVELTSNACAALVMRKPIWPSTRRLRDGPAVGSRTGPEPSEPTSTQSARQPPNPLAGADALRRSSANPDG